MPCLTCLSYLGIGTLHGKRGKGGGGGKPHVRKMSPPTHTWWTVPTLSIHYQVQRSAVVFMALVTSYSDSHISIHSQPMVYIMNMIITRKPGYPIAHTLGHSLAMDIPVLDQFRCRCTSTCTCTCKSLTGGGGGGRGGGGGGVVEGE